MNVLFLSQGSDVSDHPGWHDGMLRLQREGMVNAYDNIPYLGFAAENGWDRFYDYIVDKCNSLAYDVVYFQYFHRKGTPSPRECVQRLRQLDKAPLIITSAGDPFSDNLLKPDYPQDFKEISRLADITFSTQMGKAADKMVRWGAKNIIYMPNGMCQKRFNALGVEANHTFDFDVVFVGSRNNSKNPGSKYFWATRDREELVKKLSKHYGRNFGLFGHNWDTKISHGPIPFSEQQNTFRRGRVVVGGNPYSYSDYYTSNRAFFEVASGIPTVELKVPRIGNVLRNNDHVYWVDSIGGITDRIDRLLDEDASQLYQKSSLAAQYIEDRHTQYHRMKFKMVVSKHYIEHKNLKIDFPYFLDEVDIIEEHKFATRLKAE
ncbi:hypothetical protein RM553_05620 [Zunongwangia sp. F363]|uniref:Spore protein YkvP/CgeB glycosyl transferase-like domain-containing protein n=1 Tax=Autumnicola tepida TaxID=3075595 RepID=A0ABU3C7I3_9FLAO|nr:hypothetical protein [Zunongwangia sp. F363]MDT0642306.1 hypothetical protein [Zunongwangia sp. F363]